MCRIILTCFIILLSLTGNAQDYSHSIRNYKAIDGLPQSQVNSMLEDRNGYLWIGTHGGGLARFDGRQFKVYTTLDGLLSNIVTYLELDAQQNLWIVHPRGISKFDGVTFKKFTQPGSPVSAKRLGRAFTLNDTLFILSASGTMAKIYGDSVFYWSKPVQTDKLITYCHVMPDKNILLYANDSSFQVMSIHGDYHFSHKNRFNKLFGIFNYQGKVWLTTDQGRFTIDFSQQRFVAAQLPVENRIFYVDTLNQVFWTWRGNNLMKEKIAGQAVVTDTVLKDVSISQVLIDSEGNTWFASQGMGLYKYFIQDFDHQGTDDISVVMAIYKDSHGARLSSTSA